MITITENGIEMDGELKFTWEQVDAERNKFRFKNTVLVKVGFQYGRDDYYDEQLLDKDEWTEIKNQLAGKSVWYHDFAGKHSAVNLNFWNNIQLREISDQFVINEFFHINGSHNQNMYIIDGAMDQLDG